MFCIEMDKVLSLGAKWRLLQCLETQGPRSDDFLSKNLCNGLLPWRDIRDKLCYVKKQLIKQYIK